MDNGNENRDFLGSRRARITPEQAGLPAYGGNRRVAGLRREEVALLAGVSIDYYTPLERGPASGPADGGNRRVAGRRREEVALLAGVSIDYYTRLERGRASGASDSVLEGIARALHLDEAERAHLFDLARAAAPAPARRGAARADRLGPAGAAAPAAPRAPRRPGTQQVRPSVRRILESMTAPAYVRNPRCDILAANR